jgi:hypothetical protein
VSARFLTAAEVADLLRMTPKAVRAKARRGEIPAFKAGPGITSPYRFDATQIELLIAQWKRAAA